MEHGAHFLILYYPSSELYSLKILTHCSLNLQLAREIRHREHGAERERTPIFAMTSKHYDETAEVP